MNLPNKFLIKCHSELEGGTEVSQGILLQEQPDSTHANLHFQEPMY